MVNYVVQSFNAETSCRWAATGYCGRCTYKGMPLALREMSSETRTICFLSISSGFFPCGFTPSRSYFPHSCRALVSLHGSVAARQRQHSTFHIVQLLSGVHVSCAGSRKYFPNQTEHVSRAAMTTATNRRWRRCRECKSQDQANWNKIDHSAGKTNAKKIGGNLFTAKWYTIPCPSRAERVEVKERGRITGSNCEASYLPNGKIGLAKTINVEARECE